MNVNEKSKTEEEDLKPTVLKSTDASAAKKAPVKKAVAKKTAVKKEEKPAAVKPAVKARKPISKEDYARTTSQRADATSVIPTVSEDIEVSNPPQAVDSPDKNPVVTKKTSPSLPNESAASVSQTTETPQAKRPDLGTPTAKPKETLTAQASQVFLEETGQHQAVEEETLKSPAWDKIQTDSPVIETRETSQTTVQDIKKRRKVRRKLSYIEPWSVTKMAFVISVAMMIVFVVAAVVFWFVLQVTGVWQALNDSIVNVLSDGSTSFNVNNYVGLARITGLTLIVSAFNVVFFTALATIGAHLYNLAAGLMGGVEVTFEERNQ